MSSANRTTIDIAVRPLLTPCLDPQVEHVVQIDVGQQRRGTAALRRPFLHSYPFPILQHAGVQPFLDQPHDAPVRNPVLDELHQPFVAKAHRKSPGCPDRAPSSLFSSAVPYTAHPALDAGCARAGTHTRSRESPFRRWHSTPRPPRAGRFCLPAPVTPSGLCRPSALGIYTLRTGLARYAPRFSLWERSWRLSSRSSP